MKKLDLSQNIYELTTLYPELIDIMSDLGFSEIKKEFMRKSMGKLMTLPKGAKLRGIGMEKIIFTLLQNGFELTGEMPDIAKTEAEIFNPTSAASTKDDRIALLKGYLNRLNEGEDLAVVREDFVKNFKDVEASEIMRAEQELIREGETIDKVQKLCDVHSALFHGTTRQEKIANAEKEVAASLQREFVAKQFHTEAEVEIDNAQRQEQHTIAQARENIDKCGVLVETEGHPLQTFTLENTALAELIAKIRDQFENGEDVSATLAKIREVAVHYAKKGDLLYPHLKVKYDIVGPSQVMWTLDDEIRNELSTLTKIQDHNEDWKSRILAVVLRAEEMIYKEKNILFPVCAANFTDIEWQKIYRDSKDYAVCLGVASKTWPVAENYTETLPEHQGEIVMPGGHLTVDQLTALLNTIPMEITFVDGDNINRFFNEGEKVFHRPQMAIDREVFSCHPPKIEPMVRAIIDDFRTAKRDKVSIWMEKNGRTMLVNYMAVRDHDGNYVGTAEFVQDMEFAKEHFLKQ